MALYATAMRLNLDSEQPLLLYIRSHAGTWHNQPPHQHVFAGGGNAEDMFKHVATNTRRLASHEDLHAISPPLYPKADVNTFYLPMRAHFPPSSKLNCEIAGQKEARLCGTNPCRCNS